MTSISRRRFLKVTGAVAAAGACPAAAAVAPEPGRFDRAEAKLYDATRCIGCRNCLRACREVNQLGPEPGTIEGVEFDMPRDLSPESWLVIQAYRQEADREAGRDEMWSFVNKSCMHCNVPACASVCPVAALEKTDSGPVVYHEDRCIGCRYCLLACPYGVPRYEWVDRSPRVRKCNWKLDCVRACPTQALVAGSRRDLIAEAHRRIGESPERYFDHVYGEHEGGGTSYLIIAGMPFEQLGLPVLPETVRSGYADAIMRGLPGLIIGLGLFLGGLYQLEQRQRPDAPADAREPDDGPEP